MNARPIFTQATPVEPLPMYGSSTVLPNPFGNSEMQ